MASFMQALIFIFFIVLSQLNSQVFAKVSLKVDGLKATICNDLVSVAFKADSQASSVTVNGKNIAATADITFFLDWHVNGLTGYFTPKTITVVENTSNRAHFYWTQAGFPGLFQIELHYLMIDGVSGIYSWAKYTNNQNTDLTLQETRTIYRFDPKTLTEGTNTVRHGKLYLYSYLNNQTKIQDETWQLPDGSYYTKYDFAGYIRETPYQGVYGNGYGAFVVSASREYHGGGPLNQDLLIHQDSLISNYFVSSHFGVKGLTAPPGWNHIYGPWLVYFNTGSDSQIIDDVAKRAQIEQKNWPYDFVGDKDYATARGSASGKVSGQTRATVVLYDSNEEFNIQCLGYLYTNQTDSTGQFKIANIRPGIYNVAAYPLAGQGSENLAKATVTVIAGSNSDVGILSLPEPENIIWSIGEANRRSSEFQYSNQFRNYVFRTLPPENLTFTIGSSKVETDWYYAQSKPGIWTIKYQDNIDGKGRTLRIALAAASKDFDASNKLVVNLIATLNGHKIGDLFFENDKSIYRSAMQSGTFYSNVFAVNKAQIIDGENTLSLQMSTGEIMYDAISLQRN